MGQAPLGWDQGNWDDPNMHSVKYDTGRMLQPAKSISDVDGIVKGADFQKRFPGATFNGKDIIDYKGAMSDGARGGSPVGTVDVLGAADPTTNSFERLFWGPTDLAQEAPASNRSPVNTTMPVTPGSSDLMTTILESLQDQQAQPIDPQELLLQSLR